MRRRQRSAARRYGWGLVAALALLAGVALWMRSPEGVGQSGSPEPAPPAPPLRSERQVDPTPAPEPRVDLTPPAATRPAGAASGLRVALVIDDLGRSITKVDGFRELGAPLTYAVLPFEPRSEAVIAHLLAAGEEVLCHMPMEPLDASNPGPGALDLQMSPEQIRTATEEALAATAGAAGVNNHMGSAFSADAAAMRVFLEVVGRHGLYFLDSRTTAETTGYAVAAELGLPAAERKVFLDRHRSPDDIRAEFRRTLEVATRGEPAIAIGHPYDETLAVLREEIPRAEQLGFRFVRVSDMLAAAGE